MLYYNCSKGEQKERKKKMKYYELQVSYEMFGEDEVKKETLFVPQSNSAKKIAQQMIDRFTNVIQVEVINGATGELVYYNAKD